MNTVVDEVDPDQVRRQSMRLHLVGVASTLDPAHFYAARFLAGAGW